MITHDMNIARYARRWCTSSTGCYRRKVRLRAESDQGKAGDVLECVVMSIANIMHNRMRSSSQSWAS
jgi:hypothetical protein